MSKYSIDLINRYINGLDIEEYSIDELEDDPEFMLEVIKKTGDKNIYNLFSSSVKLDYQLVKYLVLNFSNDLDFIVDAANNYIDNTRDEINPIELSVIMLNILPKDLAVNANSFIFVSEFSPSGNLKPVLFMLLRNATI